MIRPRYKKGQQVTIAPAKDATDSLRDSTLKRFSGQGGKVTDYYWVSLDMGAKVFYIYTVKLEDTKEEVVLHEDELEAQI